MLRRIYWGPADFVSWHRPSVTTPRLALVVGWCHVGCCRPNPFCVHLGELYSPSMQDRQLNQGLLATWVSIPFQSKPLSKGLTLQWDITGSTAWGTMAACENVWLQCSRAFAKSYPWTFSSSICHWRWNATQANGRLFPYSFKNDLNETCSGPSPAPCHGFLALAVGFVPLFAVHLATSASSTCPNVCTVHLAMSTCLALLKCCRWAFPVKRKGDNLPLRPQTAASGH